MKTIGYPYIRNLDLRKGWWNGTNTSVCNCICNTLSPDDVDLEHDSAFRFLTTETLCVLQRYSVGLTVNVAPRGKGANQ